MMFTISNSKILMSLRYALVALILSSFAFPFDSNVNAKVKQKKHDNVRVKTKEKQEEKIIPEIIKCTVPKSKKGKVCIIRTDRGKKGTIVSIYDQNHYWVATGTIYKRQGNKAIIIMKNTINPIFTTYSVEVGKSPDWKQSFSNHDFW